MQQGLALPAAAVKVSCRAVFDELGDVSFHGLPSLDLSCIIGAASAQIIATVPLKPAAGIVGMNPAFGHPVGEGFGGVDAEAVELRIMSFGAEFGFGKPGWREFIAAVGHVFSAEDADFQHLLRCQFRFEFRIKLSAGGFCQNVSVTLLHPVMDDDFFGLHFIRTP